ncbi:unnamed protein product [Cyprideis torosa]|uniref:Uncharacterized protein n=1 Tax=Cyprideis torosa TaxID=163714 RepID=A0A7R8WPG7_9CRUS|nr:unnamed protein product [Cyprideis torosa]CAG0907259.1 unnamed protein product [Cyprideis torosa]
MTRISRRAFLRASSGLAILGLPSLVLGAQKQVVVVGGGAGGATAAKYLRKLDPTIAVTLIEARPHYVSCFMSNEVLSGSRTLESLTFGYDGLRRHGVDVVIDTVVAIDPVKKTLTTASGKNVIYDACVVSPGIDFKWEAIEGYNQQVSEHSLPHAWKTGPQIQLLRHQLEAMPDGGRILISAPPSPYKCPPGPYDRASQMAMYCKRHKPKSKILILDPKNAFSKQELFIEGWSKLYGFGSDNSMIEWIGKEEGGAVESVDTKKRILVAGAGTFDGDVVNIIPAQKAGAIAFAADLVDGDWCPVDKQTFESRRHKDIYVLGDASDAQAMPKSAYAANSQAKVAAAAITARFNGLEPGNPTFINTCYSIVGEDFGISVAAVYGLDTDNNMITKIKDSGGLSPSNANPQIRKREVSYAHGWFENITHDMFK